MSYSLYSLILAPVPKWTVDDLTPGRPGHALSQGYLHRLHEAFDAARGAFWRHLLKKAPYDALRRTFLVSEGVTLAQEVSTGPQGTRFELVWSVYVHPAYSILDHWMALFLSACHAQNQQLARRFRLQVVSAPGDLSALLQAQPRPADYLALRDKVFGLTHLPGGRLEDALLVAQGGLGGDEETVGFGELDAPEQQAVRRAVEARTCGCQMCVRLGSSAEPAAHMPL